MSQINIQKFLNELSDLRRFSGTNRETVVREAFKDLLKSAGRARNLIFIAEYDLPKQDGAKRSVDGALVYDLRVPFGYWEAKDEDDDLDAEIAKKLRRGYPRDNIIFEDSQTAVLMQNGNEAMRCPVTDLERLARLLELFFAYEPAAITQFRKAVAQFQKDIPDVLEALRAMIEAAQKSNVAFRAGLERFLKHAQETINPAVSPGDVREMLIQHILTEEIFAKIFGDDEFHRQNNVAKELYALENLFFTRELKRNTLRALDPYYTAIRASAQEVTTHKEKQKFLKVIHEGFYKVYNKKAADRLGVVYTPQEIVTFMVESADWLCHKHFGKNLIDSGVDILDPATGTGTFICELLEHFRGQPVKMLHKYKEELHANEVAILPYYVANLNIEATYQAITGTYREFQNLCFVDTLDNVAGLGKFSGHQEDIFGSLSAENVARIRRQNEKKISVIIGNPPYNAWQENFNMRNPNRAYRRIDERIAATYIARGTAQNKNSVYDMYARFFRWASDRLKDDGVIAFITNRNLIEKAAFDGFRRVVADEFSEIRLVDLGGDVRANPKLSGTKQNVFGIQTGVTISFFVKRKIRTGECRIFYSRRPEMEAREDKLAFLTSSNLATIPTEELKPNDRADWIGHTANDFSTLLPMAARSNKAARSASQDRAIFRLVSNGVQTKRDEWVYDFDHVSLSKKMKFLIKSYERARLDQKANYLTGIKWDAELERYRNSNIQKSFGNGAIRIAAYRPFVSRRIYFDKHFNARHFQLSSMYLSNEKNPTISYLGLASDNEFTTLAVDHVFDLGMLKKGNGGTNQGVSRYRYTASGDRLDNITDWSLDQFQTHYGANAEPAITRDAIFHYVYGVLHDPLYRVKYAQNLKREFPRIPFYTDFWQWAAWGEALMALHIGYESVAPWPLARTEAKDEKSIKAGLPPKVVLKANREQGIIVLDSETQLAGVPPAAWDYKLGNRSGLDWILDQYKEKTPKDPTIREKFDTYRFKDYKETVVDLLMRVTRVSVETMAIVEAMRSAAR